MLKTLLTSLVFISASAFGQAVAPLANMVSICSEGCTISTLPVGTVYQFGAGAGATYTPAVTSTAAIPKLPFYVYYTSFSFDPDQNVLKSFWVQQQAKTYSVSWSNGSVVNTTNIPALPVVTPPVTTPPVTIPPTTGNTTATSTVTLKPDGSCTQTGTASGSLSITISY